ncbi:hypothetical protein GGS20DRAFT_45755 [Poronia punctata]|nr:hypothetical protein GGS20DRAFT_45755 [Poronia punctata]
MLLLLLLLLLLSCCCSVVKPSSSVSPIATYSLRVRGITRYSRYLGCTYVWKWIQNSAPTRRHVYTKTLFCIPTYLYSSQS